MWRRGKGMALIGIMALCLLTGCASQNKCLCRAPEEPLAATGLNSNAGPEALAALSYQ